jgi:hypothetical protein
MGRTMLLALALAAVTAPRQSGTPGSPVFDCVHATLTRPGTGHRFTGTIANADYALSAHVPDGLTAWSGVAEEAPFHGFSIALDSHERACIVFEVHLRVAVTDAPARASSAIRIGLGRAQGWQSIRSGRVAGVQMTNVSTVFSFSRGTRTDNGEVLLIVPTADLGKAGPVYDAFIRSIRFGD